MALALTAVSGALLAGPTVVDKGRAQCCSSIAPEEPPATYYGATMVRRDDALATALSFSAPPEDPPGSIEELEARVDDLELRLGPMARELADPLRGLAAAYLSNRRELAAIDALRRAIHVVRLNGGLYTREQVGLLEQLIATFVRMGDYVSADEQQAYLYRVLSFGTDHTSPGLREATLRYADWMRGAYLGDLDRQRFGRLVSLNDLYENAMEEIEAAEGADSRELLPYLQGRAQLSYLISVYPGEEQSGFRGDTTPEGTFEVAGEAQLRFWRMQTHNFRYGLQALRRRSEIIDRDPASTVRERVEARIAMADWHQWHRRYAHAIGLYEEAWELADGDTMPWLREAFQEPLELPRETVFSPGAVPIGTLHDAEVAMRFDVSRQGEAKDITILSESTEETQPGITRAYHYLRNVRFRPKVSDGSVVRAEDLERRYYIRY